MSAMSTTRLASAASSDPLETGQDQVGATATDTRAGARVPGAGLWCSGSGWAGGTQPIPLPPRSRVVGLLPEMSCHFLAALLVFSTQPESHTTASAGHGVPNGPKICPG
jgi:hypothetical protein